MSTTASVGNIHVALYVDISSARRFTDAANIVDRDTRRMRAAVAGTDRSVTSLRRNFNQGLRFRMASESLRTISRTNDELSRLRATMLAISALTGTGITGAFGGAWLLQTADKARLLSNQLKTVTKDSADLAATQDLLYDVSQRTRSSMESTIKIYARTARATEHLGMSQERVLRMTETIQKAFAIGGASTAEAMGAAIQLSQGIASDRFSGEEFRSVAENAPVLLRGIAESLGVNIGKLREMAHAGKLTAEVVTKAIVNASKRIDEEFQRTAPTVGQSLVQVENAFIRYIGETDSAYGVTKNLAEALKGLADNFEEVMYWIGLVGGGMAALWGGKAIAKSTVNFGSGVTARSAALRDEMKSIDAQIQEDRRMLAALQAQKPDIASRARRDTAKIYADRAANMHKLSEREYVAAQGVATLERRRLEIATSLASARTEQVGKLQREVEIARQAVRDDQLRVIRAQEAALAEERNLRARQQQKVASADDVVRRRGEAAGVANARVQQTAEAIAKEADLRKAKILTEVETRKQSLVTQTMRLRGVQNQIAELRNLRDMKDFDKAFGGEYRGLLKQQQDAIVSTRRLRGEIRDLTTEYDGIEAGTSATRGMTAAMNRHAAAVKQAEAAVAALSKAEANRAAIASAPVSGKTLDARLRAEANELARYEKSVANLQAKMRDLSDASTKAFDTAATRKLVGAIGDLDKKLVLARQNLAEASRAVAQTSANDAAAVGAVMAVRQRAIQEYQDLERQSAELVRRTTENVKLQARAQANLNLVRRAGASIGNGVLGFFGGWTGLAITTALVAVTMGMANYAARAQKAAEQTERINKLMRDLGYLATDAADGVTSLAESIATGRVAKLQTEIADFREEMEKTVRLIEDLDVQGAIDEMLFKAAQPTAGPIDFTSSEYEKQFDALRNAIDNIQKKIRPELESLRQEMIDNKGMSQELRTSLEDMALANPELAPLLQSMITMGERMNALSKTTEDWVDGLRKAREQLESMKASPTFRSAEDASMAALSEFDQNNANLNRSFLYRMQRDAAMSEYESAIQAKMQTIMDAAEKLGSSISLAAARVQAESLIAAETSRKGLRDLIAFYEGTDKGRKYNETLGYGKFTGGEVNLTAMTLREVLELQKKMLAHPENTFNSSAVGRYQIVMQTLIDQMQKLGLSMDDFFTADLQDRIADNLIRQRGRDPEGLRNEWEGLRNAPDWQIMTAFDASSLSANDEGIQKWIDGFKSLDLQALASKMNEFTQSVAQQAQAFGATEEEVRQYFEAVQSGNLDAIPEKFRAISEAMALQESNTVIRELEQMDLDRAIKFLSDLQQKTIETARAFGVSEAAVRAYIEALRTGGDIPSIMAKIHDSVKVMTEDERFLEFTDGLAESFGGLTRNLLRGRGGIEEFVSGLADLILEILVIQPLIESLKTSLRGMGSGGGFAGWLGSIFSGLGGSLISSGAGIGGFQDVFDYDEGGWTGPGSKMQPAGVVHADEYVFNKKAVQAAGVKNLEILHEILNGRRRVPLPEFSSGGFAGRMPTFRLPTFSAGGSVNQIEAPKALTESSGGREPAKVILSFDKNGNLRAFVEQVSRQSAAVVVEEGIERYEAGEPDRVDGILRDRRARR